jgi:hypothetical protein
MLTQCTILLNLTKELRASAGTQHGIAAAVANEEENDNGDQDHHADPQLAEEDVFLDVVDEMPPNIAAAAPIIAAAVPPLAPARAARPIVQAARVPLRARNYSPIAARTRAAQTPVARRTRSKATK